MTTLTNLLCAVLSFVTFIAAAPAASLKERDVVDPPVTAPNATSVWVVGSTQTVVWDTSSLPSSITNSTGTVLLGFVNDTSGNEHLMNENPLAAGFDITIGHVDIVVPNVDSRNDYVVALLGDSGNISPKFTITGPSSSSSGTTSTLSSVSSAPGTTVGTTTVDSATPTVTSTGLSGTVVPTGTANSLSVADPVSTTTSVGISSSTTSITAASTTPAAASTSPIPTTSTSDATALAMTPGFTTFCVAFLAMTLAI